MKISISGKGGSGKSTVTTLLAMELRDRGYRPLIVDADESNTVLYRLLGLSRPPQPLVALAGGRQMVRQLMPPGYKPSEVKEGTHILTQAKIALDEIPLENISERDNLRLVIIGKIVEPLEGCACPMGVLGKEFLAKLQLKEDEIVITDMEAGIEHFGRGFESSLDSVLVVVEPSFESVSLAERIRQLADEIGIKNVWTIVNKANSDVLANKLKEGLAQRDLPVIGSIPYDEAVFNACLEGRPISISSQRTSQALAKIADAILAQATNQRLGQPRH